MVRGGCKVWSFGVQRARGQVLEVDPVLLGRRKVAGDVFHGVEGAENDLGGVGAVARLDDRGDKPRRPHGVESVEVTPELRCDLHRDALNARAELQLLRDGALPRLVNARRFVEGCPCATV
jgi:hypothetical protein